MKIRSPSADSANDLPELRRRVLAWFKDHGRDLPWRRTRDPYAILVSEVMLQQTQVATVIPYYNEWLRRFPDFAVLAKASEDEVLHAWQGLGYYSRARNLRKAAVAVQDFHGGSFPRDIARMQSLPGIGRYTANALAAFAFGQPVPVVEVNIARLLARLYNIRTPIDSAEGRQKLWARAAQLAQTDCPARFTSALMDLGATVCLSRAPKCEICPVRTFCRAPNPGALPLKKSAPPIIHLTESHALAVRPDAILLERCTKRWRGMWMLPPLRRTPKRRRPVHTSVFPFTHHRVTLEIFPSSRKMAGRSQQWVNRAQLSSLAIPSPHRRAIEAVLNRGTVRFGNVAKVR